MNYEVLNNGEDLMPLELQLMPSLILNLILTIAIHNPFNKMTKKAKILDIISVNQRECI